MSDLCEIYSHYAGSNKCTQFYTLLARSDGGYAYSFADLVMRQSIQDLVPKASGRSLYYSDEMNVSIRDARARMRRVRLLQAQGYSPALRCCGEW